MTTHTTTRRSILFGAAAVPLAAVAASAAIVPTPIQVDPIFSAIEKHRRLQKAAFAIGRELSTFEDNLPKEVSRLPRVETTPNVEYLCKFKSGNSASISNLKIVDGPPIGGCHYVHSFEELRKEAKAIPKEHRDVWLADRRAALRRDIRALKKLKKEAGLSQLTSRHDVTYRAEKKAEAELCATMPTTIAGIAALADYACACERETVSLGEDSYDVLELIAKAAAKVAA